MSQVVYECLSGYEYGHQPDTPFQLHLDRRMRFFSYHRGVPYSNSCDGERAYLRVLKHSFVLLVSSSQ